MNASRMHDFMIKMFAALLFTLVPCFCYAESLYVRPNTVTYNGDGTGPDAATYNGEPGKAWDGFSNIHWGGSAGQVGPNDTLYLIGGQTYHEYIILGASGTEDNVITITVYGEDAATIDCDNSRDRAIDLNRHDYIKIDGVRGDAYNGDTDYGLIIMELVPGAGGIYGFGTSNIEITHVDFDGSGVTGSGTDAQGPVRMGSNNSPVENIEISYCWIHGASEANKWSVSAITIFSEYGDPYISRLIHHNRVENIYHDGIKVGGRCSIYNNYIANIEGSGHSDSIMISSSSYVKIYNNFIDDSDDQNIFLDKIDSGTQSHIYIYNNIFDNNNGFGVVLKTEGSSSYFDNIHLYNNTFVSTSGPNLRDSQGRLANVYIKNNIFSAVTGGYQIIDLKDTPPNPIADADAYDYNCYDPDTSNYPLVCVWPRTTGRTFAELQAMSVVRETHGVVGTPVYVNPNNDDFDLGDTCPETIRTGGVDLSSVTDHLGNPLFNTDYYGNIRTVWSMGAYEYVSVAGLNQRPVASFTATPTGGSAPLAVNFTDTSNDPDGTIVEWNWNFGDGGTSTEQSPNHTYDNLGTYTVSLKVTDNEGAIHNASTTISVYSGETVSTYIEAESGSINSPLTTGSVADPPAAGDRYIYAPAGTGDTINPAAEAVYNINIPSAGDYYLWLRIYGPGSNNDAIYVGFNGNFDRVYPTQYEKYEWVKVETVHNSGDFSHTLSAGTNQIKIGHGEELTRADMIFVTDEANVEPVAPPTGLSISVQ